MSTQDTWFAVDAKTGILHALDDSEKPVCGAWLGPNSYTVSSAKGTIFPCCRDCFEAMR